MFPLNVIRVPIVECQGEILIVDPMDIEFLAPIVDLPDYYPPRVLVSGGPDEHNQNRFYLGILQPDGTVDCIHLSSEIDQWRWYGEWFGYPDCCIDAFCNLEDKDYDNVFIGTGYVPCKSCVSNKSVGQLVSEISLRRKSSLPFPLETRGDDEHTLTETLTFLREVMNRCTEEGLLCV